MLQFGSYTISAKYVVMKADRRDYKKMIRRGLRQSLTPGERHLILTKHSLLMLLSRRRHVADLNVFKHTSSSNNLRDLDTPHV